MIRPAFREISRYLFLSFLFFIASESLFGQQADDRFFKKEDIPLFNLKEVVIYAEPKFSDATDLSHYYYLKRKVIKMHPYSIRMVKMMLKLDARLNKLKNPRQRKKYVKRIQSYMKHHYTDSLLNMTTIEGQVLCKMINRYTGKTLYEIVTHYQGSWSAFWWNTSAGFFDISLKEPYKPGEHSKDSQIEYILQQAFADQTLSEFDPMTYEETR